MWRGAEADEREHCNECYDEDDKRGLQSSLPNRERASVWRTSKPYSSGNGLRAANAHSCTVTAALSDGRDGSRSNQPTNQLTSHPTDRPSTRGNGTRLENRTSKNRAFAHVRHARPLQRPCAMSVHTSWSCLRKQCAHSYCMHLTRQKWQFRLNTAPNRTSLILSRAGLGLFILNQVRLPVIPAHEWANGGKEMEPAMRAIN